ncbi:MAG: Hpt domain-containing protein, partial [Defluviitaleaceae bacterium]|nr:Hpt domain-containing protein [Defluviitaleaceae bacterium]
MADFDRESMIEMFIFEMSQLIESLEQTVVQSETGYNAEQINEIFRVMHTIKGSAAMMMYDNIEKMAHSVEDLFYYLREESPVNVDYPTLSDHVLEGADFIKAELGKIQNGITPDGNATELIALIKKFLNNLKNPAAADAAPAPATQEPVPKSAANNAETDMHTKKDESTSGISADVKKYRAKITFAKGCEMENIRAYTLIHNFTDYADHIVHEPSDVIDENSIEIIRNNGFIIEFTTIFPYKVIYDHLMQTVYLQDLELAEIGAQTDRSEPIGQAETQKKVETLEPESKQENANDAEHKPEIKTAPVSSADDASKDKKAAVAAAHVISVNVGKLDNLLNLMGELVIAEAMVTQNSELDGLQLDSFQKETRQLRKIIANLRDTVMSMRMVPLSSTFFKMHRIVRDMCRQLNKDVDLKIIGEENEVDKNTVEHIADPIMHIIRNSVDHGIEKPDERLKNGKPEKGTVILEAKNAGGDVLITIKDDGAGLNREKILKKAMENGLLTKAENEYTDKEIYQFIFMPGF